jgi:predicted Zn finger-like uncharacterized protein
MRIVCPNCEAEYEVPDHLLRPGRATKCARCAHRWVPLAAETPPIEPAPAPEPDEPAEPAAPEFLLPVGPTAMDRLSVPPPKPRANWGLRLAWLASVLVLIAAGVTLYAERAAVMTAWPPSQRLYGLFGLVIASDSPHPAPEPRPGDKEHGHEAEQHPATGNH